jgi:LPS-assembly lipoprotein
MIAALTKVLIVGVAALGLAGCFQPLHGGALSHSAATLAQIEVAPIAGHLGHQLKSELDFLLSNGSPPDQPVFRLTVRPTVATSAVIVDGAGGRPQTLTYNATASFQLISVKDGSSVSVGTVSSVLSIDRTQQRFATVRALRDADIRAARVLADQIRARLVPGLFGPKT